MTRFFARRLETKAAALKTPPAKKKPARSEKQRAFTASWLQRGRAARQAHLRQADPHPSSVTLPADRQPAWWVGLDAPTFYAAAHALERKRRPLTKG